MFSPKFAWNDYFTGSPETTLNSSQYSSRQTPSVSSVYVSECLFNKCTISSGNGGALYCSTSVTYFLVEFSSFFSCKTNSGEGGAVHFYNSNSGQSVLYAVCGNDCCSTGIGLFARIFTKEVSSNKNYVKYTSIVRCVDEISNANEVLCLERGIVFCPSINMSLNKCKYYSGIFCVPSTDSSTITCSLLYSTFANSTSTQHTYIWISNGGAKYEIKCSNIIRNTQVSSSNGIIYTDRNLMIEDSSILENTATYIFYQASSSYTITLSNCTVDKTTYNRNLIIQKTVTKSFIHGLNHMSTQNCHSEYDSAGTLTAIPYVSHSTKKIFCHTCQYKPHIGDFISLVWVFIITFIYPSPSDDFWYDYV